MAGDTTKPSRTMPAARFKAHCLELMDRVGRTGEEIVITKHARPVAKLVPVNPRGPGPRPLFGRSRGVIQIVGDIVAPIAPDWEPGADY
jgi:prevent-host-death family protein